MSGSDYIGNRLSLSIPTIERLRVQPLCFLRRRIVGSDAVESGHAALRTRRGRLLPCTPPSWKLPNGDTTPAVKPGLRPVPRLRNSNHRTLLLGADSGLDFTPSIHARRHSNRNSQSR
jgi:hypothetical protein